MSQGQRCSGDRAGRKGEESAFTFKYRHCMCQDVRAAALPSDIPLTMQVPVSYYDIRERRTACTSCRWVPDPIASCLN